MGGTWIWIVAVALSTMLAGCVSPDQLQAVRDEAASLRDALAQDEARWAGLTDTLDPADPLHADASAQQALAAARRQLLDAALAQLDLVLQRANNPDEPISQSSQLLAPLLPASWQLPVILGGALAGTILRASQLKQALASVARGIEAARRADPQFDQQFLAHANTFRATQTPTARRVIDETTHDRFMLRLPL